MLRNAGSASPCWTASGIPVRFIATMLPGRRLMTAAPDDQAKTPASLSPNAPNAPDFVRYLNVRAASGASFAPDGRRITFLTDITGVAEVWSVAVPSANGGAALPWPEQLTFGGERILGAAFSPVADRLIVGSDVGGND